MASKVRKDYKRAFERLVASIRFESSLWRMESEKDHNDSLQFRHEGMHSLCEHLLENAERYEADCKGQLNENGRVSLHLYDRANGTYVYDLDRNVGELPELVWCEYMNTPMGNGFDFDTPENHMHHVRMNGEFGVPLTAVWPSDSFCWKNDRGQVVDGPKVWVAKYRDTAFASC